MTISWSGILEYCMPFLYTINIRISCHIKIGKICYNYENVNETMNDHEERRREERGDKKLREN